MKLTYARAGVDIHQEERAISALVKKIKTTRTGLGAPIELAGHFVGLVEFGKYAIAMCTDGVGSKVLIASALKKWDTVGIDCIAMNVNDMVCIGAEPVAFVDYLAMEKPSPEVTAEIGAGLARGAELAGVSIIGGETATLPEIIKGFDLAGACLGYVDKSRIISGEGIEIGDTIIGLRSSGIHSNGLTLARAALLNKGGYTYEDVLTQFGMRRKIGEELLEPTRIYVREVLEVIRNFDIHGLAHITGGGVRNLSRLKSGVQFKITDPFEPQQIFRAVQELGNIDNKEMYQTFNMGMGFCIIARSADADEILNLLKSKKMDAKIVGSVVAGKGVSLPGLGLTYQ